MITINRSGYKIAVWFDTEAQMERPILPFERTAQSEVAAELMARELRRLLHDRLHEIRRSAYEQGYKDGRGKQRRRAVFANTTHKKALPGCY